MCQTKQIQFSQRSIIFSTCNRLVRRFSMCDVLKKSNTLSRSEATVVNYALPLAKARKLNKPDLAFRRYSVQSSKNCRNSFCTLQPHFRNISTFSFWSPHCLFWTCNLDQLLRLYETTNFDNL